MNGVVSTMATDSRPPFLPDRSARDRLFSVELSESLKIDDTPVAACCSFNFGAMLEDLTRDDSSPLLCLSRDWDRCTTLTMFPPAFATAGCGCGCCFEDEGTFAIGGGTEPALNNLLLLLAEFATADGACCDLELDCFGCDGGFGCCCC
jgi:hypothetical protein